VLAPVVGVIGGIQAVEAIKVSDWAVVKRWTGACCCWTPRAWNGGR
jgi:hypothetical protein